jgi:hypothetical protein
MAKILFTQAAGGVNGQRNITAFFEGWIRVLVREGNDVMHMVTNDFLEDPWNNPVLDQNIDPQKLADKIKDFNPDIIISSNNSIAEEVIQNTNCPIVAYSSDHPRNHFSQHYYKKYQDRYYFFCGHQETLVEIKELLNIGDDRVFEILPATDVRSDNIEQDKNITFIGSHWGMDKSFQRAIRDKITEDSKNSLLIRDIITQVTLNPSIKPEEITKKLHLKSIGKFPMELFIPYVTRLVSCNFRLNVLSQIATIDGFYLYGPQDWMETINFSIDLALSYRNQTIVSLEDVQNLYNSSKIGFNTSHFQTKSGFSWRVRDVMATNAVLVSDERSDFKEFFPKIKIPTYSNAFEAKKICQDLLKDDLWRKDISLQCQEVINSSNRFEHRLKDMEGILNMSFLNKETGKEVGSYCLMSTRQFTKKKFYVKQKGILGLPHRAKNSIKKKLLKW